MFQNLHLGCGDRGETVDVIAQRWTGSHLDVSQACAGRHTEDLVVAALWKGIAHALDGVC